LTADGASKKVRPMKLYVNGEPREVESGLSVAALLETVGAPTTGVAVEVNAEIVRRAQHAGRALKEGDRVEIVTFVGGG
jgi:sulfur carrier protein